MTRPHPSRILAIVVRLRVTRIQAEKGFNSSVRCKDLAGIPAGDHVHAVLVLGYPDVTYRRPVPTPGKTIHWV